MTIELEETINLGSHSYYTVADLSRRLNVPQHHLVKLVRQGHLHGRRLGTVYLIDAEEFNAWVRSGNFEYKPRQRYPGPRGRQRVAAE